MGLHLAHLGTPWLSWAELRALMHHLPATAKFRDVSRDAPGKAPYQTPHSQLLFMILDELRNIRAGAPYPMSASRLYDGIMGVEPGQGAEGVEPIEQAEESIRDKIDRIRKEAKEQA